MEGREHMIRNEINILKRVSQGNKNILSLVDYFETLNNCKVNTCWIHRDTNLFISVPCHRSGFRWRVI